MSIVSSATVTPTAAPTSRAGQHRSPTRRATAGASPVAACARDAAILRTMDGGNGDGEAARS
jgi:hypothetical protein